MMYWDWKIEFKYVKTYECGMGLKSIPVNVLNPIKKT